MRKRRMLIMIKRDPQEIADFFECKVQVNQCTNNVFLWDSSGDIRGCVGCLEHQIVHKSNMADGKLTYEPQKKHENSDNKDGSYYQDFADSDNNAPHQSEVHTHREYVLLGEFSPSELCVKVSEYLEKGFKLYGYPWTGPDCGRCGYIHYQAMVRGLE